MILSNRCTSRHGLTERFRRLIPSSVNKGAEGEVHVRMRSVIRFFFSCRTWDWVTFFSISPLRAVTGDKWAEHHSVEKEMIANIDRLCVHHTLALPAFDDIDDDGDQCHLARIETLTARVYTHQVLADSREIQDIFSFNNWLEGLCLLVRMEVEGRGEKSEHTVKHVRLAREMKNSINNNQKSIPKVYPRERQGPVIQRPDQILYRLCRRIKCPAMTAASVSQMNVWMKILLLRSSTVWRSRWRSSARRPCSPWRWWWCDGPHWSVVNLAVLVATSWPPPSSSSSFGSSTFSCPPWKPTDISKVIRVDFYLNDCSIRAWNLPIYWNTCRHTKST